MYVCMYVCIRSAEISGQKRKNNLQVSDEDDENTESNQQKRTKKVNKLDFGMDVCSLEKIKQSCMLLAPPTTLSIPTAKVLLP